LVKADGFDSSYRKYETEDWIQYCDDFYSKIGISMGDTIFEIGCGSGAFLYPLYLRKNLVGGIDYSINLLDLARKFMPESNFTCEDAVTLKLNNTYDVVLSHSVFQYFHDLNQAEKVLKTMNRLAKKKVAILDVIDVEKFDLFNTERMKKFAEEGFSEEDYRRRYLGLDHLLYSKEWFEDLGQKLNLETEIFDQKNDSNGNSKLIFNVIFSK
jgi:ubiquinone/menaquinone biosynthesis C-methylase UbiE